MWGFGGLLSGLGKIGSAIGGGIKKGVNKLGELQQGMEGGAPSPTLPRPGLGKLGPGGTAGFNPNAPLPSGGMMSRRPQSLTPLSSPQQTMPVDGPRLPLPSLDVKPPVEMRRSHPPLTGFNTNAGIMEDTQAEFTDRVDVREPMNRAAGPRLAPSPIPSLDAPQMTAPYDPSSDSRKSLPVPSLPNRGGPKAPTDYNLGEYDYWAKHAKRDAAGNFDPKGGTNRNWKSILQNALLGAASQAEGGDVGRMIGGALGGGLGATIDPQSGYENAWAAGHGRRINEAQARDDAEIERQRKGRMGGLGEREAVADVTLKEAAAKRAGTRRIGEATWGTYDQETGQPIWQRPAGTPANAKPQGLMNTARGIYDPAERKWLERFDNTKPPTMQEAEADRAAEEGTVEKIAMDSYEGRGGDNYIIAKMPPQLQQALKNPTQPDLSRLPTQYQLALKEPDKYKDDAGLKILAEAENARNQLIQQHQALVMQAQNEFQQMKDRELANIRRYTEDEARRNAGKRRQGGNVPTRGAQAGNSSGGKIKLSAAKDLLLKASGGK